MKKVTHSLLHLDIAIGLPTWEKKTKKDNMLLNTEHQKVNKYSGELEQGTREMTEERLLELLYQEKANSVRGIGKSLDIKNCDKQQKHEIIRKIRDHIIKDNNKFNNIFRKFWGTSGGYLTGVCPQKVVYFVKFQVRAEGTRDYIDLFLSMKYQPNILISDMPQIIASHGNKSQMGTFAPHEGRVCEAMKKNISKAENGSLEEVSFPWLDIEQGEDDVTEEGCHLVSGSSFRLALFDWFHEGNTESSAELLRRVHLVNELKGKINTQVEEQLHRKLNRSNHFLNQMDPVRHIFMFRLILEKPNEDLNKKFQKT